MPKREFKPKTRNCGIREFKPKTGKMPKREFKAKTQNCGIREFKPKTENLPKREFKLALVFPAYALAAQKGFPKKIGLLQILSLILFKN